jgi:hypothetical protein
MRFRRDSLSSHELRCFCRQQPLLAVYGYSIRYGPYVHIKVYKQRRLFGEVVVTGTGSRCELTCRDCLRHHVVTISGKRVAFDSVDLEDEVDKE